MQITDILAQLGGLRSVAHELGVSQEQAGAGADALLPAILGGFKKQAGAQPAGLEGLGGLLGRLGGGGLLDQVLRPQPTDVTPGNEVLGQIFGSKEVSRTVAQNASAQTGLDPALLKKMLPLLAMLVTGLLARQQEAGGAAQPAPDDSGIGGLLGGALGGTGGAGGGLGGLLGGLLGGSSGAAAGRAPGGTGAHGLGGLLDLNGDGNALDDILRMAGKAMR